MPADATSPAADTVPALLERAARRSPGRTAFAAPGRAPLAYGALAAHLDVVGARLRAMGIGREDRVALALRNGPEMATAFLAVAGTAVCAPLDPRLRTSELDDCLADLDARAVIVEAGTDSSARSVARARGMDVIELAAPADGATGMFALDGAQRGAGATRDARPDDLALLLHTSGTTARPKLVPLLHRNLASSARAVAATLSLVPDDRGLAVMPLFHIHGLVASLLAPLASGASVVCAPAFSTASFFECLDAFEPTWYTAVPTMHQAILAHAPAAADIVERSRLRFVRSSSAPLPASVMSALEALFRAPVIEAYGMTEAAHQIASNPLPPRSRKPGSVGPAAGAEIAIADAAGQLLDTGLRGEVVIRGPGVMAGYANTPVEPGQHFFGDWFRTGDEGRLDADGYLHLTGRLKEIVNRGGEKISPREIDDTLLAHPAVEQAAAFAVPHETLGEDVAAAVVLRRGATVSGNELREWLLGRLADVKVPSRIVLVDAIPKGPTGKIVRTGLAEALAPTLASGHAAPGDPLEAVVAGVFRDVLGGGDVGADDNFFALGGDSLRGADVAMRLQVMFGVDLGGAAVFRSPSPAALARDIRARRSPAPG